MLRHVQRALIVVGLVVILFALEFITTDSLLINIPDYNDILDAMQQLEEQEEIIPSDDPVSDPVEVPDVEDPDPIVDIDSYLNAFTLEGRNGPEDYQNLFADSVKHTFIIDFDSIEWYGLVNDMVEYNNEFGTYRSNNYRKVTVTYIADDDVIIIPEVGIRSKGNIFSRYPPLTEQGNVIPIHYVLKFNETFDYDESSTKYKLLKKREVFDLEKLVFKWNRNNDPTYISEIFSMRLFSEMGVPVPSTSLTKFILRVDGEVKMTDLYNVQESIDEEFIRKHLQDVPTKVVGDLYKAIWPGTLEPISSHDQYGIREWETNTRPTYGLETNTEVANYQTLINFTFGLDESNPDIRRTFIEQNINVDNLIRALAVSIFLGNPDDYRGNANNYYIYFDENNVFTYIPFDFDHSLGQGWDGFPVFIDYSLGNDIYIWEGNGFGDYTDDIPLVDNILLAYEDYQILYEDYLEYMITTELFSFEAFSDMFDTFESVYGDEFTMSNNKEYYFTTKIEVVTEDIAYYREQREIN